MTEAYSSGLLEKYQVQSTGISNFKFTDFLNEVKFPLPSAETAAQFDRILTPLMELIAVLGRRNVNLRTTRDLLLPKLISGEIPVEAAEETAADLVTA